MRVFNRLLVLALGVAIAAAGVLVILEAIWTWTNSGFVWIPGRRMAELVQDHPVVGPDRDRRQHRGGRRRLCVGGGGDTPPTQTSRPVLDRPGKLVAAAPVNRSAPATPPGHPGAGQPDQGPPQTSGAALAAQGHRPGRLDHQTGVA